MLKRQTSGSVVCPTCGRLVGVQEQTCPHCGRPSPGLWGYARFLQNLGQDFGFVPFVIGVCVALYLLMLIADPSGIRSGGLSFLMPSHAAIERFGASGAGPVFFQHRWWTVLSANWLHGGVLHILFNMMWVRQLGPATARLFGPGRMILIYLVAGVSGFVLSSVAGFVRYGAYGANHFTLGASAAVFGLLGALVLYGRRTGSSAMSQQVWSWAIVLFVFGLVMDGVDNFAHFGGFAGGYLAARWFDPLKPERIDHLLAAVIGLGLSLLSILLSVLTATGGGRVPGP